jgi:hypothetical protein
MPAGRQACRVPVRTHAARKVLPTAGSSDVKALKVLRAGRLACRAAVRRILWWVPHAVRFNLGQVRSREPPRLGFWVSFRALGCKLGRYRPGFATKTRQCTRKGRKSPKSSRGRRLRRLRRLRRQLCKGRGSARAPARAWRGAARCRAGKLGGVTPLSSVRAGRSPPRPGGTSRSCPSAPARRSGSPPRPARSASSSP